MARPKKSLSSKAEFLVAEGFRALSHPSRLEIIKHLASRDHCCAGDFCGCMPIAQSTISQHLDILKSAGIIEWRTEGTKSIYRLNRQRLSDLAEAIGKLSTQIEDEH